MSTFNTQAIYEVLALASKLTYEEQRELNRQLVDGLKRQSRLEDIQVAVKFVRGDIVQFDAGVRKGMVRILIDSFSRDMSKVKGLQLVGQSTTPSPVATRWTASAKLCSKV